MRVKVLFARDAEDNGQLGEVIDHDWHDITTPNGGVHRALVPLIHLDNGNDVRGSEVWWTPIGEDRRRIRVPRQKVSAASAASSSPSGDDSTSPRSRPA